MTKEEHKKLTDHIVATLGDEVASTILDDLALLGSENEKMLGEISSRDSKISSLEERNTHLQKVNSSLYQQVGNPVDFQPQIKKKEEKNEAPKEISFKSFFDENGNFKKT